MREAAQLWLGILRPDPRDGALVVDLLDAAPLRDLTNGESVVVHHGGFGAEAGHVYRCGSR